MEKNKVENDQVKVDDEISNEDLDKVAGGGDPIPGVDVELGSGWKKMQGVAPTLKSNYGRWKAIIRNLGTVLPGKVA